MLQEAEAKQWLEEAYDLEFKIVGDMLGGVHRGMNKPAMRTYKKLKMSKQAACVETQGNLYALACEKMQKVVAAQVHNEENYMICIVGSGVWSMNPAVVELSFGDTHMEITAWAKEGIIKQHTAEKAIQTCLDAFDLE